MSRVSWTCASLASLPQVPSGRLFQSPFSVAARSASSGVSAKTKPRLNSMLLIRWQRSAMLILPQDSLIETEFFGRKPGRTNLGVRYHS